jgi:hypothetical protein
MAVIGKLVRGALAGAVGTLAMDLVLYRRYRAGGGEDRFADWEFSTSTASFEDASAPGKVAEKAADAVGIDLPESAAGTATDVVHWLTGAGYGVAHALFQHDSGVLSGVKTGSAAFLNSYATLGALGIYQPIWEYDRKTLEQDFTAHLAFGFATGVAYRLLSASDR